MKFRPMKASTLENENLQNLKFPLFASAKVDGIRCVIKDGVALSSALKPIRNGFVQNVLAKSAALEGFDGELLLTNLEHRDRPGTHDFGFVSSAIMGSTGTPDFTFWVFDCWNDPRPFVARLWDLIQKFNSPLLKTMVHVKVLPQQFCETLEELMLFESVTLEAGYEGVMTRVFDGKYKFGDSTLKEQYLLKRKPFADSDGVVVGFEEELYNSNEAVVDNLGHAKRSTHKDGMMGKNTLGKFKISTPEWGDFFLGKGKMTHNRAKEIWDNREDYLGKIVVFKYQKMGLKDKPRLPIFKGFRDIDDITTEKGDKLKRLINTNT